MPYDDLVKRLREHNGWALNETLDQAADAIEKLSKLHETQKKNLSVLTDAYMKSWIPVTERLPYESVFVHGKGGELVVAQYSHKHKWWEDDEGYYCDTNYVTHWMPLPEPPKEESNGV